LRLVSLFFLLFFSLYAKSSYEKGKELYNQKACYSCHGHKAEGMHRYPYLANRAKGYLSYKLKRFRAKQADNQQQEMMITFAQDLSDEDIDNLTTFFANYKDDTQKESYDDSFYTEGDGGS